MGQRTISVPQRAGALSTPIVYEAVTRIVAGVNAALTQSMAASAPTTTSGTLAPTNPVVKLLSGGTVRNIAPVDFDVPIYLIATGGDVVLETGGNIGGTKTILSGMACALVRDATGVWWPTG